MSTEITSLWEPSKDRIEDSNIVSFIQFVEKQYDCKINGFNALYEFSINQKEKFWSSLIEFSGLVAQTWGTRIIEGPTKMPGAKWFPDAKLNYAENLLRRRDSGDAIVFWGEDKIKSRLSHKQLFDRVSRFSQALKASGISEGDRVGGYLPNMPETIIAMLKVLGFGKTTVNYHYYKHVKGKKQWNFTVVGERTIPIEKCDYDYDAN